MRKFSLLLTAFLALLSGCSDESSSDGSGAASLLYLNGKVSDPAVEGAKVELLDSRGSIIAKCGVNGNTVCNVWSKPDGTFRFALPKDIDYKSYTLKTHGGKDTQYGYNIEYSLSRSLSLNNQGVIMVTPVTSLISEISALLNSGSQGEEAVMQSLNLKKQEIYSDAESSINVLKASYLLNAVISVDTKDSIKTMGDVAKVLQNGSKLEDKKTLGLLITNPVKLQEIENIILSLNKITSSGLNVEQAVKELKKIEKHRMFLYAFNELSSNKFTNKTTENISILINMFEKELNIPSGIPLDQFIISELVRYMGSFNSELITNSLYEMNRNDFINKINAIIGSSEKTVFYNEIKIIVSEKIYNVNVPVNKPLGMDNQARVDYYFNSNKDINYKARQLTKIVLDDSIREEIYSSLIRNYAVYGLFDRAENLASIQMKDTLKRLKNYAKITNYGSKYYAGNKNIRKYADKAYKDIQQFNTTSPEVSKDYIDTYISIIYSYAAVKDSAKLLKVKDEIYGILDKFPVEGVGGRYPYRSTYYARVYNAIGDSSNDSLIYQVIESGDLEGAFQLLKIREQAIDNAEERPTLKNRNVQLNAYGTQLILIGYLYSYDRKNHYRDELKTMIYNIIDKMTALKKKAEEIGVQDNDKFFYTTAFIDITSVLSYTLGDYATAEKIYAMIKEAKPQTPLYKPTVEKNIKNAAASIFIGRALRNGFNDGIKYFEKEIPLDSDYGNLFSYYMTNIVGAGGNAETRGYVYSAIAENRKQDALKAVEYMKEKVFAVMKDKDTINKLPDYVKEQLITNGISSDDYMDTKYIVNGVTALAKAYIALGYKDKAVECIKKGDIYLAMLEDSIAKYDYNMALANMAKEAGDMDLFYKYYNDGLKVSISNNNSTISAYLHLLKAADANYFNLQDKNKVVADNLQQALNYTGSILEDENMQKKAEYYTYIAKEYYNAGLIEQTEKTLLLAEKILDNINNNFVKKLIIKKIMLTYGRTGLLDEGYNKALELGTDIKNRNEFILELVKTIINKSDFGVDNIATVDTDKDGKPDFFYPWVTEEDKIKHKLELDDDIDGDGINDNEDTLPYVKNK